MDIYFFYVHINLIYIQIIIHRGDKKGNLLDRIFIKPYTVLLPFVKKYRDIYHIKQDNEVKLPLKHSKYSHNHNICGCNTMSVICNLSFSCISFVTSVYTHHG